MVRKFQRFSAYSLSAVQIAFSSLILPPNSALVFDLLFVSIQNDFDYTILITVSTGDHLDAFISSCYP